MTPDPAIYPTTLLVVEDQAVVAADLADRLVRNGYEVCGVAASGEEALVLAHQHRPSLALMDIRIQGEMDGIQTAEILRRELDIPVIFLSAHSDESTLQRAKLAAPYAFLIKPFEERELRLNIEVALHKHAGERQLAVAHQEIRRLNASLEQRVAERTAEVDNARHMAHLVDDLLSFINLRQQALSPMRVDVAATAREVLGELIAAEPSRHMETRIEELPACQADPVLLRRLLVELLSNALKFSLDRRPAIIAVGVQPEVDQPNQHVYFVRDNGIGFDPRYADKLFKLFSQLNLPGAFEGNGAGLAKARRIVERMGGRIWAEPAPEGGATFFFTLPATPTSEPIPA